MPRALDALDWLTRGQASLKRLFRDYGHLRQWYGAEFGRALLAQRIRAQLRLHLQIEAEIVFPAARAVLPGDRALAHATLDIHGMFELLDRLDPLPLDEPDFDATLAVLEDYADAHMQEVQAQIFSRLRRGGLDTMALGAQIRLRFESLGLDLTRFGAARSPAVAGDPSPAARLAVP